MNKVLVCGKSMNERDEDINLDEEFFECVKEFVNFRNMVCHK